MPDYTKGKIYKLICDDPELIYIGSTTEHYLSNRLSGHRQNYKKGRLNTSSKKLFEVGGVKIELIELYPCECKEQLLLRERYWLENTESVNLTKRPFVSYEEKLERKKEYNRLYYQDNREQVLQQKREYNANNRDKKKEYDKKWQQDNREKSLDRMREYYQKNREEILQKAINRYHKNKINQ